MFDGIVCQGIAINETLSDDTGSTVFLEAYSLIIKIKNQSACVGKWYKWNYSLLVWSRGPGFGTPNII